MKTARFRGGDEVPPVLGIVRCPPYVREIDFRMNEHRVAVEGSLPQMCEPFDPPHWAAYCDCGTFYIGFGEDDVEQWATKHVTARSQTVDPPNATRQ